MSSESDAFRVVQMTMGMNPGGIAIHIRNLTVGLRQAGHRVVVAAGMLPTRPTPGTIAPDEADRLVCVRPAFLRPSVRYAVDLSKSANALAVLLHEERPDVLHLHSVTQIPVARLAMRLAGRSKRTAVVTTFNNEAVAGFKRTVGRLASRWLRAPFGDASIAISQAVYERVQADFGVPDNALHVIDYGVDDHHFRPPDDLERREARQTLGLDERDLVVCCVASLDDRKNQRVLVDALARLGREHDRVTLLLAGPVQSHYAAHLRVAADRHGLRDRVVTPGLVDARTVFWAADVNALVSRSEGFGLVVTEGALCGLPAIRSRSAGASEQVEDGVSGWMVDADDIDAIAAAMRRLANNSAARRAMGQAARAAASQRFTIARMAAQVESIYGHALHCIRGQATPNLRCAHTEKPAPVLVSGDTR